MLKGLVHDARMYIHVPVHMVVYDLELYGIYCIHSLIHSRNLCAAPSRHLFRGAQLMPWTPPLWKLLINNNNATNNNSINNNSNNNDNRHTALHIFDV